MVVAVEARRWWHCDCNGSGGAVMAVAVAARDGAMMIIFSGAKFTKFCLLCLLVVCSSWLYHSTYNTLEDMIEFWRQMVRNLMMHFPLQHSWLTYTGTGTSINEQHFDWWAGSKNWLKIFVGNFSLGFSSRQILICTFGKKESYLSWDFMMIVETRNPQHSVWLWNEVLSPRIRNGGLHLHLQRPINSLGNIKVPLCVMQQGFLRLLWLG